ncbi:MAG: hypothetical protein OYH77_05330 [Pseudomonadota bacterium]|nr:hypothetical protein [Pseudomonadota bacterium]
MPKKKTMSLAESIAQPVPRLWPWNKKTSPQQTHTIEAMKKVDAAFEKYYELKSRPNPPVNEVKKALQEIREALSEVDNLKK